MTKKFITSIIGMFSITSSLSAQDTSVKAIMTKKYDDSTNLVTWPEEFHPSVAKWYVYNEIEINASPGVVWEILIDAKKWHTYYEGIQSPVEYSDTNAISLKNGMAFKMHTMGLHLMPVIKEFVPGERLAWLVRRSNLNAYHAWVIVPTPYGCRLVTPESQNGFLTFLQKVFQPNKLLKRHDTWLRKIKAIAEKKTSL